MTADSDKAETLQTEEHRALLSKTDLKATLHDLLTHFQTAQPQGAADIEHFADEGATAILTQLHNDPWIDNAQGAATLGIAEGEVQAEIQRGAIPAVRGPDGRPRIHRRDLSLYRLAQQLGPTDEQVSPLTPPIAWSDELDDWGFNPWRELTPG